MISRMFAMYPAISICLVFVSAITFGAGVAYRVWIRPIVCDHFGEEFGARGNGDAKKRRRSFERLCGRIAAALFAAGTIAAIHDLDVPVPQAVIWASEMVTFLIGGLLCWAAIARWNDPFN